MKNTLMSQEKDHTLLALCFQGSFMLYPLSVLRSDSLPREWCQICELQRFSFRTRDQAWSLKSLCVAELYWSIESSRESFWHRHQKGDRGCPLSKGILARELYTFSTGYYSKSKECFKVVRVLPDPLLQYTF